jgi:hypothetical protein
MITGGIIIIAIIMATFGGTMRIASVKEFKDQVTEFLKGRDPVMVLRHGKLAGILFPHVAETIPLEFKKELFKTVTDRLKRSLRDKGVTEEEVLQDFARFRKASRKTGRGR